MSDKCIAIIPARGGSKRIPRKNIRTFIDKPIISYSIKIAIESGIFSEVMVSTDDSEIAEIAKEYGAKVPFLRKNQTANDFATISDVIHEVIDEYKKTDIKFDYFCCIFATAPFLSSSKLIEAFDLLKNMRYNSVFSVLKYNYPIQRALEINNKKIQMIWPENINKRSQDLIPSYHDAGQFYWMNVNSFKEKKKIFTDNSGVIVLSDLEAQDIDTEEDWKIAEIKYKILNTKINI